MIFLQLKPFVIQWLFSPRLYLLQKFRFSQNNHLIIMELIIWLNRIITTAKMRLFQIQEILQYVRKYKILKIRLELDCFTII